MNVEIFNLCDFASADAGGKLNMLGVFNTIFAQQEPIIYGLCAVAIRIRFEPTEEGLKKFRVSFVNEEGRAVLPPLDAEVQIQSQTHMPCSIATICLLIQQINLPNFGEYSIGLSVDGKPAAKTPLFVQQMPVGQLPRFQNFPTTPFRGFPTPPPRV
jgi:hypothetical protein